MLMNFSLIAQDEEITGKWKFDSPIENEKIDEESMKMLIELFGSTFIDLRADGSYELFMMGRSDQGEWSYNEKAMAIEMSSAAGGEAQELIVLDLEGDLLTVKMGSGGMIMKREASDGLASSENAISVSEMEPIAATTEQVCKRWYLKSSEAQGADEEKVKSVSAYLIDFYFEFKKNGKYTFSKIAFKEKGKWEFGPENKQIKTSYDGNEKVMDIYSVSDDELVIMDCETKEKWFFTTKAP